MATAPSNDSIRKASARFWGLEPVATAKCGAGRPFGWYLQSSSSESEHEVPLTGEDGGSGEAGSRRGRDAQRVVPPTAQRVELW